MIIANLFTSHNISLKENEIFFSFSQIENQRFPTSLNNNIQSRKNKFEILPPSEVKHNDK